MYLLDRILDNKSEIIEIFSKYGADNIVIIGSVNQRREGEQSDIDFVADLKKRNNGQVDLDAYVALKNELKEYFNRKIDLADHAQIEKQFPNALRNGTRIEQGNRDNVSDMG